MSKGTDFKLKYFLEGNCGCKNVCRLISNCDQFVVTQKNCYLLIFNLQKK